MIQNCYIWQCLTLNKTSALKGYVQWMLVFVAIPPQIRISQSPSKIERQRTIEESKPIV